MGSKQSFIDDYERGGLSFSELCRRHGISRSNGYKWCERYRIGGERGLEEHSRRPHYSPHRSDVMMEEAVLKVRREHPVWGGRKIRKVLEVSGVEGRLPAASTISNILRRHDLLGRGTREGSLPFERFERAEPNDLWQMDFKGWITLNNGKRCYPLTILDDHSRFNILLKACKSETEAEVTPLLQEAFQRFGLPRQILCDHGNPWGRRLSANGEPTGPVKIEIWLTRLGVELIHGRVRHPQTQGKEERFHRTLKAEVLGQQRLLRDHLHCQQALDHWQWIYNCKRPHESLQMDTPSSRYIPSIRSYPDKLPDQESFYLDGDIILKVKSKGEITFKNHFFYIGTPYYGCPVALRPRDNATWEVYYCWKSIGIIDFNNTYKQKGRYHCIR